LRERLEDIPHLVEVFLKKMNRFSPKEIQNVHPQVTEAFKWYSWPGNIRELENLMERAHILETSSMLTPESFPSELFGPETLLASVTVDTHLTLAEARHEGIKDIEQRYLKEVLARNRGRIKESATAAGVTTRQLHKLMKKYEIRKEQFKS
jgi:DNA-binding NtrC family response regulator